MKLNNTIINELKNKLFTLELSSGTILNNVSFEFPIIETDETLILKMNNSTHIINLNHIIRITSTVETYYVPQKLLTNL